MKNKLRPYLIFSKKERTGIAMLVSLCLFLFFLPEFFPRKKINMSVVELPDALKMQEANETGTAHSLVPERVVALFPFNPNTIDSAELMRLGLEERLVKRIMNYRNKGGRFYKAEDLKKIWGMPPEQAAQLIPFVVLPVPDFKTIKEKAAIASIDINTADAESWKALPGIGETLANRIIKYRNQSDGFGRIEELGQVFGLTDSTLLLIKPYLRVHAVTMPKLWLNRASAYQLVQKTGIPAPIANAIVKTRLQQGNFRNWEELQSVPGINAAYIELIRTLFQLEE